MGAFNTVFSISEEASGCHAHFPKALHELEDRLRE